MRHRGRTAVLGLLVGPAVGLVACEKRGTVPPTEARPVPSSEPPARPGAVGAFATERDPERARETAARYNDHLQTGRRLVKEGQYAKAIAVFDEAVRLDPNDPALLGEYGWAAFKAGQVELSLKQTRRALQFARVDRRRGALYYNLGRALEATEPPELPAAAEAYRRSLALRPHATVEGRLADLVARHSELAAPASGEGEFPSPAAVCEELKTHCADYSVLDEGCECDADVREEPLSDDAEAAVALFTLSGAETTGPNEAYFLGWRRGERWTIVGGDTALATVYNPGMFGIQESGGAELMDVDDYLPGGMREVIVSLNVDRFDLDAGDGIEVAESLSQMIVCSFDFDEPRCAELTEHYASETTQVDVFGDGDGDGDDDAGRDEEQDVPEVDAKVEYSIDVTFDPETGTVSAEVSSGDPGGEGDGERGPGDPFVGTASLADLLEPV